MSDFGIPRFDAKIDKTSSPTGCWLWTAGVSKSGYGNFGSKHVSGRVHRLAWALTNGPIPDGMMVAHRCDVRRCLNVEHLFLTDAKGNAADTARKGRAARMAGERNGRAILTNDQARAIISRFMSGDDARTIAVEYPQVALHVIKTIKEGGAWRALSEEMGFAIPEKKIRIKRPMRQRPELRNKDIIKFHTKIEKTDTCWLWRGRITDDGYGSFHWNGGQSPAHHVSLFVFTGAWPDRVLDVAHLCQTKNCLRPEHLKAMTRADHMAHDAEAGCFVRPLGERNNTKVTEADIIPIRLALASGMSTPNVAKKYSVQSETIDAIGQGRTWSDIGGPTYEKGTREIKNKRRSKINEIQVLEIRAKAASGVHAITLAAEYKLTRRNIDDIIKGRTWQELPVIRDVLDIPLKRNRPERDSAQEAILVETAFRHYRKHGFPQVSMTLDQMEAQFRAVQAREPDLASIAMSHHGMAVASAFFPQRHNVRCHNLTTPMEAFLDDQKFREILRARIRYGDDLKPSGIRRAIRLHSGVQCASNFRPMVMRAFITRHSPKLVLDPCAGWGGRLLGTLASGVDYVGIDASRQTIIGLQNLAQVLHAWTPNRAHLFHGAAEDYLGRGHWQPDLIMTSPPYFDLEKYSDDQEQSYIRYPTREAWLTGFLAPLITGAAIDLTPGGHLILNIPVDLEEPTKTFAKAAGLTQVARDSLVMPKRPYQASPKAEPILAFQKGALTQIPFLSPV